MTAAVTLAVLTRPGTPLAVLREVVRVHDALRRMGNPHGVAAFHVRYFFGEPRNRPTLDRCRSHLRELERLGLVRRVSALGQLPAQFEPTRAGRERVEAIEAAA